MSNVSSTYVFQKICSVNPPSAFHTNCVELCLAKFGLQFSFFHVLAYSFRGLLFCSHFQKRVKPIRTWPLITPSLSPSNLNLQIYRLHTTKGAVCSPDTEGSVAFMPCVILSLSGTSHFSWHWLKWDESLAKRRWCYMTLHDFLWNYWTYFLLRYKGSSSLERMITVCQTD